MTTTRCGAAACALLVMMCAAGTASARQPLAHPRDAAKVFATATQAGNAEAIADLYASDALFLLPNQRAIVGKASIMTVFARNFQAGANSIRFTDVRVDGSGDRAVIVWSWISEIVPPGRKSMTTRGRSMLYFVRSPEHGWLISADMMQLGPAE